MAIKALMILLCISYITLASAQPGKGTLYFGGSISGDYNKIEATRFKDARKIFDLSLNPQAGYFLNRFIAISPYISYSYNNDKTNPRDSTIWWIQKSNTYVFGPKISLFLRVYKPLFLAFNTSAALSYRNSKSLYGNSKRSWQERGGILIFGPEILYFTSSQVALSAEVNYNKKKAIIETSPNPFHYKNSYYTYQLGVKFFINKNKSE